jgi:ABC-type transport system involved in multi-copper enzyme maturation permease subunit
VRILAVAANSFRESVRERVLYNLVFFAILMILSGSLMSRLAVRQDEKIIKDLGLASVEVFGTLIAMFVGVALVNKEVERKSLYALLAKPLERHEFILGKFLGLSATLLVNTIVMTAGLLTTLWFTSGVVSWRLIEAIFATYLGMLVVVALALLFSTVTTSFAFASICTVCVVIAGRFSDVIRNMKEVLVDTPPLLIDVLYYALPNFKNFDLKNRVVYGDAVTPGDLSWIVLYAALYVSVSLAITIAAFRKKEFV